MPLEWTYQESQQPDDAVIEASHVLRDQRKLVVVPGIWGYSLATTCVRGVYDMFDIKERPRTKPMGIHCHSIDQLCEVAELNSKVEFFLLNCFEKNIPVNCILKWRKSAAEEFLPNKIMRRLVQDHRGTSCFKIKSGEVMEKLSEKLWKRDAQGKRLVLFTTSAKYFQKRKPDAVRAAAATDSAQRRHAH